MMMSYQLLVRFIRVEHQGFMIGGEILDADESDWKRCSGKKGWRRPC